MLITTDGITSPTGEEFGLDRLTSLLGELAAESAEQIATRIGDSHPERVRQHSPADDDQTRLVVRAIGVGVSE